VIFFSVLSFVFYAFNVRGWHCCRYRYQIYKTKVARSVGPFTIVAHVIVRKLFFPVRETLLNSRDDNDSPTVNGEFWGVIPSYNNIGPTGHFLNRTFK
jgi:hypothetical protein